MDKETLLKAVAETEGKLAVLREEIIDFVKENPSILTSMLFSYSLMPVVKLSEVGEDSREKIAALSDSMAYAQMLSIILENHNRASENENMDY